MNDYDGQWIKGNYFYAGFFLAENIILENIEVYCNLFIVGNPNEELSTILTKLQDYIITDYEFVDIINFRIQNINKVLNINHHIENLNYKSASYLIKKIALSKQMFMLPPDVIIRDMIEDENKIINEYLIESYMNGTNKTLYSHIGEEAFHNNILKYHKDSSQYDIKCLEVWYVNTKLNKFFKEHIPFYSFQNISTHSKCSSCCLSLDMEPLRARA